MTCYRPMQAWQHIERKGRLRFNWPNKSHEYELFNVPCGQCSGCRLVYSRHWAIRCYHEASLYEDNCFITLTYAPEYLPEGGTLVKEHFVDFMKRLRAKFSYGIRDEFDNIFYQRTQDIRFFSCGEYGGKFGRPHYHAILFNVDFPDKYFWRNSKTKDASGKFYPLFRSKILEELWPYGNCEIGTVTFQSAAYVARYIMKKVKGRNASEHYRLVDPVTFEIFDRIPEYCNMSRRPGIGKPWLDKFYTDVFPDDFVIVDGGKKVGVPRYYSNRYKIDYPDEYEIIKVVRKAKMDALPDIDKTYERLAVREKVKQVQLSRLLRDKVD